MKSGISIFLLALGTFCLAQKKEFDTKMLGCYKGSEVNQQVKDISKYWVSCRLDGGKSVLLFVVIDEDGAVKQTTENGTWWTNGGKYYEQHDYDHVTDVYNYKVLGNGDVEFSSVELMGKPNTTYQFTDYKVSDL